MMVMGLLLPWLISENITLQMNIIKMHFIGINVLLVVEMLTHKLVSVRLSPDSDDQWYFGEIRGFRKDWH